MNRLLRRARSAAGYLALLATLGLVAALLVSGVPRLANGYTDEGLQADIGGRPHLVRDLTFDAQPQADEVDIARAEGKLLAYRGLLPAPLPGRISAQWFAAQVGPERVQISGARFAGSCGPQLAVRYQSGIGPGTTTMIAGRLPATGPDGPAEVMLSAAAADQLGARVGDTFSAGRTPVEIVGIYAPRAADSPDWDNVVLARQPCPSPSTDDTTRASLLTDAAGIAAVVRGTNVLRYEWRYRIDETRLTADGVPALVTAIGAADREPPDAGLGLTTGLDTELTDFQERQRAVAALLAVVLAGLVATVLGLIVLAARLSVDRRQDELYLLRTRGGSMAALGGRSLAEILLVVPAAVLAGWALGMLLPGRAATLEWAGVLAVGLIATAAVPVLAMTLRPGPGGGRRNDLVRARPSVRRLTGEGFLLLLAVLGVFVLRQRGLSQASGVDPFLVSVPVLLAVAAALVAVRSVPWPLGWIGRLAARSRGVVPFLGLSRAGRAAPVSLGPLAVLVVSIATGVFTSVVASTIGDARDRATDLVIAGDARIIGYAFAPTTTAALTGVPGVETVAPLVVESGVRLQDRLGIGSHEVTQAQQVVLDGPATAAVLRESGARVPLPSVLVTAAPAGEEPIPAVVSPSVAAKVGAGGATEIAGRRYAYRVAAVVAHLPGLDISARDFIALPAQAIALPAPLAPNRFLLSGSGFTTGALEQVADQGQVDYLSQALGRQLTETSILASAEAQTWVAHRAALEAGGVNRVLSFTFTAGAVGATVLALLAVGFTVIADAPGRGRTLSRLRTMGLSGGQGRRLLVVELLPLVAVAVLAGGVVGVTLPELLGPALGLDGFSAGAPVRTHVDLVLVLGVPLLLVAALLVALLTESGLNRRMRLGEVLRLGEEN